MRKSEKFTKKTKKSKFTRTKVKKIIKKGLQEICHTFVWKKSQI